MWRDAFSDSAASLRAPYGSTSVPDPVHQKPSSKESDLASI